MTGMITHSGHPLDHPGHARERPQIAPEAVSPAALAQHLFHGTELMAVQPRLATRPPGAAQGIAAATFPFPIPTTDALATHLQLTRNGRQNHLASCKQARRLLAPTLQFLKIPSSRKRCVHDPSIANP